MNLDKLSQAIDKSTQILIIQPDNPDGDSLCSALALEAMLLDLGKQPILYCSVEIPTYLRHIIGWDRVISELPNVFEMTIIVDTSSISLLENLVNSRQIGWIKAKPSFIIDHHASQPTIDFCDDSIIEQTASCGELIYQIAETKKWQINSDTAELLVTSILFDTLGLTTESVTSKTLLIMSKLLEVGVNLAKIEDNRRSANKKSLAIVKYKGALLSRVDNSVDERVATIEIPWSEIEKYSHEYNPSMLVLDEMRMINNVVVAIAFKTYPDGKLTAKIRSNYGYKIASKLAEHFGGGGHDYAAGFKMTKVKDKDKIKLECINKAKVLLDKI